jgi:hypothetical protein
VEIGPNDALDVEGASIAYVENFALKVFSAADDEDRRGAATRSVVGFSDAILVIYLTLCVA